MAKAYSYDLRKKVIEAIEVKKRKKSEVAITFNISRNTIDLWLKRKAERGDYQALRHKPPGNNHKILNWQEFQEFVKENGDKTQEEMAELWPEEISARTISRGLKKIGFISSREKEP